MPYRGADPSSGLRPPSPARGEGDNPGEAFLPLRQQSPAFRSLAEGSPTPYLRRHAFLNEPLMSAPSAFASLPATPRMPALFVGHGSPMNAIEDNEYSRAWAEIGEKLPKPRAILCVSAHWMTRGGELVHVGDKPKTIHDFGGFPARTVSPAISGARRARRRARDDGTPADQPRRARRALGARPRRLVGADPHVPEGRHSRLPAFARSVEGAARPPCARRGTEAAAREGRADHRLAATSSTI